MFSFSYFFIALIALIIASYTDLKERIVSNKLSYGMIVLGLGLHALQAFYFFDAIILLVSAIITAVTFACAYGLWKLGVWAGGDVKLFTGIAALMPLNFPAFSELLGIKFSLFSSVSLPIFPLTLFIFSIFSMVPYGAFLALNGIKKNNEIKKKIKEDFKVKLFQSFQGAALIVGLNAVISLYLKDLLLQAVLIFILLIVSGLINRRVRLILSVVIFFYALGSNLVPSILNFVYLFALFIGVYALFKLFAISRSEVLKKKVKVSELEEGMVPDKSIYVVDGKIVEQEPLNFKKIINYVKARNLPALLGPLKPQGKEIVSAHRAGGLTIEEISELKKLAKEKKLGEEITVKITAPMVPAVLIAFILLGFVGDLLWGLLFFG
ncbi:MAG: A24 family peptidase C-terminal domain-containing protein [Candidatus Diapherotrites archaeon]